MCFDPLYITPLDPLMTETPSFFGSPEFSTLITAFKALTEAGMLNHQEIKYGKAGAYPFSAEEFRNAFEAVMKRPPGELHKVVLENGFTSVTKEYEGMIFMALTGPEPLYFIKKAEPA